MRIFLPSIVLLIRILSAFDKNEQKADNLYVLARAVVI